MKRLSSIKIPSDIGEWVTISDDSPTGLIKIKVARPQLIRQLNQPIGSPSVRKHMTYFRFDLGKRSEKISYYNHRVIYYLHYGVDPGEMEVDFIDNDSLNLHPSNLRLVTRAQQLWNVRARVDGNTPHKGVRVKTVEGIKYLEASVRCNKQCFSRIFKIEEMQEAVDWATQQRNLLHGEYARHL